ncbi:MAG TPA: hypothetical protein VH477_21305 [Bryobacteraceae bacterium]
MHPFTRALLWILRIAFLAALALGLALWTGHGYQYLKFHMWIGFAMTFDLLLLAVAGFLARVPPVLPLITVLWAAAMPFVGIWQMRAVPGSNHWIVQVLHLILGLGAIGLGEALSKRVLRRPPAP